MTASLDQDPCDVCGFSESLYSLESDVTSTAGMISFLVDSACDELTTEQLEDPSIAQLVRAVETFQGEPIAVAHHGLHAVAEIGLARKAMGAGPTPGTGRVVGLHTSSGGVPKAPLDVAEVRRSGLVGDEQNNRIHHGRPLQALCLCSEDVMSALRGESHPISAGLAGEHWRRCDD